MISDIPATSTALPWQADVWSHLLQQIEKQQLPHALLLTGVQHSGKARLALALARLLLCHQPESGNNCGKCHACELSRSGSHGDFRWLEPEGSSRVIKIDQVRDLVEFAGKTASLGRHKLVVLSPAESLNTAAANALLKSLEEPSSGTYIILVCHRLQGLPATIRSRCQTLKLTMPDPQISLSWLDRQTGNSADSEKALHLAHGQVLLAEKLIQEGALDAAAAIRSALDALGSGQGSVQGLGVLMANEPVEDLLSQLHEHLEQLVHKMDALALSSKTGRATFGLLDEVVRLQRVVYSGANPNRQLLVDSLSARFEMVLT
ncbi:MAG: DNA polymerase III subunit delta' [Proteobacteria bacterium]|nr:DNA polymerase III subunit delta' [Pseudomonadota bacterium]